MAQCFYERITIELHYLPSIAYFTLLRHAEKVTFEVCESFQKQTYRNRCRILGANGVQTLTVPVKNANKHLPIQMVEIDYSENWPMIHWRSIVSAYGRAPFFEYYADALQQAIFSEFKFLIDLNTQLLTLCLELLQINLQKSSTPVFEKVISNGSLDFRSMIHPKNERFKSFFQPIEFPQVFGNNFATNMSILDLLFCEGPYANQILDRSLKTSNEL